MSVTLLIIDLLQFCVYPLNDALPGAYVPVRVTCGVPGRTSVYLCATSLQNHAVPYDFYSPLSVPLERSCSPHIRRCGTGVFQEQGQCYFIGLSCSFPTIVFCYFSLSLFPVCRLVLYGWGLRSDRVYVTLTQPCTATSFNNNNNNNNNNIPALLCTSSFQTLSIRDGDTTTKLLKHFIIRTFTFLHSVFLIPHASTPCNAVGTITPSYRHSLDFILNPLLSAHFLAPHMLYTPN